LRQVSRLVERENPRSDLWNPHLQRKQGGEDVKIRDSTSLIPQSRLVISHQWFALLNIGGQY
ncbi:hypothetical protein, partial [Nostoc sp.]